MNLPGVYDTFLEKWKNIQTFWIISDTHFGDKELAAGLPDRLTGEHLVKLINSCVGKNDLLIHLGDVGNLELARQLRGHKILIMGNHDAGATIYKRQVITQLFSKDLYTKEQVLDLMKTMYPNCRYTIDEGYQLHSPFEFWKVSADNQLFDEVYEGPVMLGEKLLLSHEPINVPWAFNIHGHNHQGKHLHKGGMNVCIDADGMGYKPINLNQLLKSGPTAHINSLHRETINTATTKKRKRGGKKIGEK